MRVLPSLFVSILLASSWADKLTLDEAVAYAREHNGRIAAAQLDYLASRSAITVANAAFWPRITSQYRYVNQRQVLGTGDEAFNDLSIGLNWLLIDAGQRSFNVARTKKLSEAVGLSARNTLRGTLFTVVLQFHEALRAQELLRVSDAQLDRAEETLSVTKTQVEVGGVARKEILQAEADRANAVVAKLSAANAVNTFHAALKAMIGWEPQEELPALAAPPVPEFPATVPTLEDRRHLFRLLSGVSRQQTRAHRGAAK
ncbi:MAG: TolC family protein [Fimbriimonadales bacterium]